MTARCIVSKTERGFSLIEMVMVSLLIGLTLLVATPAFNSYRLMLIRRQACSQLIDDIRAARQRAVTQRIPVYVQFGNGSTTTNLTTYKVHGDNNANSIVNSTEFNQSLKLPKGSSLSVVSLTPRDSLVYDINGLLKAGTKGGTLIVKSSTKTDTVSISVSGIPYRE